MIASAVAAISNEKRKAFIVWINELTRPHIKTDGEQADYPRIQAHINRYVGRNTFDYFIHKDLGKFLRRELDFFVKNEVMHLDDVENVSSPQIEQYLSRIRILRRIAGKIIDFLAQLEDFQKKLWLKKRFVLETNYCITLDRIPPEFYAEIAASEPQREEWVRLFSIDEINVDAESQQGSLFPEEPPRYSVPLTVEFLKANPNLLLDTRFFDVSFKDNLIHVIGVNDSNIDGSLIHGENYQALRLLGNRIKEKVKCVYIDPPYNTASSAIPYKNDYKHSAFITMMFDRLKCLWHVLGNDGAIFVSIDKTERTVVEHALDAIFGFDNRIEELIWAMNTNNSQAPNYSTNHEYILVYAKDRKTAEQDRNMFREPKPGFEEVMELVSGLNLEFASIKTVEEELRKLFEQHKIAYREDVESQGLSWEDEERNNPWKGLYPYCNAEYRSAEGAPLPEERAEAENGRIWIWASDNISMPASKQSPTTREPEHRNYRFYKPPHPVTGKPCPCPSRGWNLPYAADVDGDRSFLALNRDGRIVWGPDENNVPRLKRFLHEVETNVGKSVIVDYSDGEKQTSAMFGQSGLFLAPKHADFVSRFILHAAKPDSTIVDCFGGSGSTAHAVIKLNRNDRGSRKFILIEMADYFDRLLKPRVLKAVYSPDWRAGKPLSRVGISQCIKLIRLESFEDTLNNLEMRRTASQKTLLETSEASVSDGIGEQLKLKYMLGIESDGSPSLLNITEFMDPTNYLLKVKRAGSDESRESTVDLLETFNWLVALTVKHISAPQCFIAKFERDKEKRLNLKGRLKEDDHGPYWFRTVTGTTPDGRKTLVIWRKRPGGETTEGIEQDNLVLDAWFTRQGYSSKDSEFGLIYVNGTNNLENLRSTDQTWKVRLIEDDFHRLMFASEEL